MSEQQIPAEAVEAAAKHSLIVQASGEPACTCGYASADTMRLLAIRDVKIHMQRQGQVTEERAELARIAKVTRKGPLFSMTTEEAEAIADAILAAGYRRLKP